MTVAPENNRHREPTSLRLYAGITSALTPILNISQPLLRFYGGFKDTVPERLGRFSPVLDELEKSRAGRPLVWIHAVSVGETAIAGPVIDAIRNRRSDVLIALSTGTFTGRDYVLRNLKPDALFFFPLDLPSTMNRLVKKLRPNCFIDVEVELWPNCFRALKRSGVRMALANGRISDRAANPPAIVRSLNRWLYGCFDALFMRSSEDVERAVALGAPKDRTHLAGNLKFAAPGPPLPDEERKRIRTLLGVGERGRLLVAGSTHPGEEEKILSAWKSLNDGLLPKEMRPLHLVLAPRHLEQVERVKELAITSGGKVAKWTEIRDKGVAPDVDVIVVDTIGELMKLYGAADAAFVGGSLIPRGGHNVLEPVAVGIPTLHGPSMANFHDLVRTLGQAGLLYEVSDPDDLAKSVAKIFTSLNLEEYKKTSRELIARQLKAADMIADWVIENLHGTSGDRHSIPRSHAVSNVKILDPLFGLYSLASHRRVKAGIAGAVSLPVPIISVGNIAFGGTAKTPMVQYLAQMLTRNGQKPGVVIRGWKGQIDRERRPSAIVSDGKNILLDWQQAGDEARLLAESLLAIGVPVAVGRDRIEASKLLIEKLGVDVILLDDGFQHTRIARNLDLVLMDSMCPFGRFGDGTGPLREPVSALSRADAIILTRTEAVGIDRIEEIKESLKQRVGKLPPIFTARTTVHDVREGESGTAAFSFLLQGQRVVALSGIANPLNFRKTLTDLGCDIAEWFAFPDHYVFKERDLVRINERAKDAGAFAAITTSKDAIRLDGMSKLLSVPLHVVEIRLTLEEEGRFEEFVLERLHSI
jgi:3-deoxy-D-manno-octulosonic-acid transferase